MHNVRGLDRTPRRKYILAVNGFSNIRHNRHTLLRNLRRRKHGHGLPIVIVLFRPRPLRLFTASGTPTQLAQLQRGLHCLTRYNISCILYIHFSEHFTTLATRGFVDSLLIGRLHMGFLTMNSSFHFNTNHRNSFLLLRGTNVRCNFSVADARAFYRNNIHVDDATIHRTLTSSGLTLTRDLLKRPFTVSKHMIRNSRLKHAVNFPATGMPLHHRISPIGKICTMRILNLNRGPLPNITGVKAHPAITNVHRRLRIRLLSITVSLCNHRVRMILHGGVHGRRQFTSLSRLGTRVTHSRLATHRFFKLAGPTWTYCMVGPGRKARGLVDSCGSALGLPRAKFPVHNSLTGHRPKVLTH